MPQTPNFSSAAGTEEIRARRRASAAAFSRENVAPAEVPDPGPSKNERGLMLSARHWRYLRLIDVQPGVPATIRDRRAGIPLKNGHVLRRALREQGLIEQTHVSPGARGSNYVEVRLPPAGQRVPKTADRDSDPKRERAPSGPKATQATKGGSTMPVEDLRSLFVH